MIAHQNLQIAKLQRALYGPRSERAIRLIDQAEFGFEELKAAATEDEIAGEQAAARTTNVAAFVDTGVKLPKTAVCKVPSCRCLPDFLGSPRKPGGHNLPMLSRVAGGVGRW